MNLVSLINGKHTNNGFVLSLLRISCLIHDDGYVLC
jgi:hypothetical protein